LKISLSCLWSLKAIATLSHRTDQAKPSLRLPHNTLPPPPQLPFPCREAVAGSRRIQQKRNPQPKEMETAPGSFCRGPAGACPTSCSVEAGSPSSSALPDFFVCKVCCFWKLPLPRHGDFCPSPRRVVIQNTQQLQSSGYGTFTPRDTLGKPRFELKNLVFTFKGVQGGIRGVLDTSFPSVSHPL